jgi:hypothetical protein
MSEVYHISLQASTVLQTQVCVPPALTNATQTLAHAVIASTIVETMEVEEKAMAVETVEAVWKTKSLLTSTQSVDPRHSAHARVKAK